MIVMIGKNDFCVRAKLSSDRKNERWLLLLSLMIMYSPA